MPPKRSGGRASDSHTIAQKLRIASEQQAKKERAYAPRESPLEFGESTTFDNGSDKMSEQKQQKVISVPLPSYLDSPENRLLLQYEPDRIFDRALTCIQGELCKRSASLFEFAYKHYQRSGRGCVYWCFETLDSALYPTSKDAVIFVPLEQTKRFQFAPVLGLIEHYDPSNVFVALAAVRTKDHRHMLLKSNILGKDSQTYPNIPAPILKEMSVLMPSGVLEVLPESLRFCNNGLCDRTEARAKEFKLCNGCKLRRYCSRECQVVAWKVGGHSKQCAEDSVAQQLEAASLDTADTGRCLVTPELSKLFLTQTKS